MRRSSFANSTTRIVSWFGLMYDVANAIEAVEENIRNSGVAIAVGKESGMSVQHHFHDE